MSKNVEVVGIDFSILSNTTIDKEKAIDIFGNDKQKEHFNRHNKIKAPNIEKALIRTMEQYFDSVKKDKIGRAYHYKLGNAYDTIQERVDKRANNGGNIGNELPFSKYMDTAVVMSMYGDEGIFSTNKKYEATITNWMYNFGFVNKELYILKTAPDCNEAINIKKRIESTNKKKIKSIELQRFFEDYIQNRNSLLTIINNMSKEGLISFYRIPKAVYKNDEVEDPNNPGKTVYSTSTATITQETADIIDERQDGLLGIHKLAKWQLVSNRNSKKVRKRIDEYEQDLKEFYKNDLQLTLADTNEVIDNELVNFYYSHVIIKKCTDDELLGYIEDKRPETYYQYVNDYEGFINSAREARSETLFKKAGIKQNEELERLRTTDDFNLRKHIGYWEDSYMDNVVKLEKSLYPDFNQSIYKKKSYRNYKDTVNESKIDKETIEIMLEEQLA